MITLHRPESIDALLEGIRQASPPLYYLAGGTDLLVVAKDGLVPTPSTWFDLTALEELRFIRMAGGQVEIGGATTHEDLMRSPLIQQYAPALVEGCAVIGGPQIRVRGTVGGNIANASPAADTVPALYTLEATVELLSPRGRREVRIESFASAPRKTVREADEVISCVRFPAREGMAGAFLRLGQRQSQAISKVSVAVSAVRGSYVGIAFGAVAPTVIRAPRAEAALREGSFGAEAVDAACRAAVEEVRPIDDLRSTAEYRRAMSGVLLRRALERILR